MNLTRNETRLSSPATRAPALQHSVADKQINSYSGTQNLFVIGLEEMSESENQDQFSCSVCLDPLKEPVTIPCGHSYCLNCITDCWSQKEQQPPYRCPQCRESFTHRPLLKKNTLLAEMMEKLQKTSLQSASSCQEISSVDCDVCITEKNRAVMSCLQCLASFCETHMQLHYQSPAFMKHKLVKATTQVQENICPQHGKLLEIYCQDDSQCICCLCTDNHKDHRVVSVESEWTNKKKELQKMKVKDLSMIQERQRNQKKLNEAVKFLENSAQEALEDCEKVFTDLICSLEKRRSEIKELIRAQEKAETDRAEDLHKQLNQELTELRQTHDNIEELLITDNQVHFLKSFQTVCVLPTYKELPSITQCPQLSFKHISISGFKEVVEDVCQQATAKLSREVSNVHVAQRPEPKTQSEFLQYFCALQLDPDTAHASIILSDRNRKASPADEIQQYLDQPERFDEFPYILCREALCGCCYWEVECSGIEWVVGVCYKGISRKGKSNDCRLGFNDKSWRFYYSQQRYGFRHNLEHVPLPAAHSSRIGVYLDHRVGTLAFYSVCDTMTLLHRVQTTFTEPLYPAFGIGGDSVVQIIGQVKAIER